MSPRSDEDGDGLTLAEEQRLGTDPRRADTDGDGVSDGLEAHGEGDPYHAPDDDWPAVGQARREYFRSDDDHDGLTLIEERRHGTSPADADSDDDGVSDFDEAFSASNPLNPRSRPADSRGIRGTEDMVEAALGSVGARYQLGAEASERNLDPRAFDSSELVEWSAARAGVNLPDGSWRQYQALHRAGGATSIETALATRGALLFHFDTDPLTSRSRPGGASVVISLGDGRVVHASSKAGEVIVANAADYDFTHAAVVTELNDFDDPIDSTTGTAAGDDGVVSTMPVADAPVDDTVMSIMPVADVPALAAEAPLPAPAVDVGDLVLGSMEDVESSLPPDTVSFLRDIGAIPTAVAAPTEPFDVPIDAERPIEPYAEIAEEYVEPSPDVFQAEYEVEPPSEEPSAPVDPSLHDA